jgi:nuclear protein localization protein 4 homolog
MIIRFQSREGQFRLTVEPSDAFASLLPLVAEKLPKNVDLSTITVANNPTNPDKRNLASLKNVTFKQVGFK